MGGEGESPGGPPGVPGGVVVVVPSILGSDVVIVLRVVRALARQSERRADGRRTHASAELENMTIKKQDVLPLPSMPLFTAVPR